MLGRRPPAGRTRPVAVRGGDLMNACGPIRLIALNIGLSAGVVGEELFIALVLVDMVAVIAVIAVIAVVATVMTVPVPSRLDRRDAGSCAATEAPEGKEAAAAPS